MSNSASGKDRRVGGVAGTSLVLSAAIVFAVLATATTAPAATVFFSTEVDGAQETPPNGSTGTGNGTFIMDTDANTLIGGIVYSGLSSATISAHIHGFAPPGTPAGILFGYDDPDSPISDIWNFMESQEAGIIA